MTSTPERRDSLNLNQITAFLRVVETGSFTAAAHELSMSASAVSKHVSQLERSLGVRLLTRTTRSLELTDVGGAYFERCHAVVGQLRAAADLAMNQNKELRGPIRVQATPGVGQRLVAPAALAFLRANPGVSITLTIGSVPPRTLARDVDVLVTVAGHGDSRGKSVRSEGLREVSYLVCAAPEYVRAHGRPRTPFDLRDHNCLVQDSQRGARLWRFRRPDGGVDAVRVTGALTTNNAMALEEAVVGGLGVGRIADYVARAHVAEGRLVVLFDNLIAWGQIVTAYSPAGRQAERIGAFIDHLRRRIA